MNYKKEEFPEEINQLIQKSEQTILTIKERFANQNCLMLKDLYKENSSHRQDDFLKRLGISCNTKLSEKVVNNNELQGLYVFGELKENGIIVPVYIGISRTVFRRLRQHVWGKNHNEATFAYLRAKTRLGHKEGRLLLATDEFKFEQKQIRNYRVVIIPEAKHYDLYFMEVYIAGRLKTYWNSFKTH